MEIHAGITDLAADEAGVAYMVVALLVFADGVFPVFPGETTVVAGATLASSGHLHLSGVFLAAWIGAFAGDFVVYGIGRLGSGKIYDWLVRAAGEERMESVTYYFRRLGAPFIIFGRFVPGLRLAVALTSGVLELPLRRYTKLELIGSGIWATYASLLGFFVGQQLDGQIWLSLLVSGIATVIVAAAVGVLYRRAERQRNAEPEADGVSADAADGR